MAKISIYILTHKKFDYEKSDLYKPLLNGSALHEDDYGYLRDDVGDNISRLNEYYAEMTGEYWVWKNSQDDIIGFSHYRRYLGKNLLLKRLDEEDISEILDEYDIILPYRSNMGMTHIEDIEKTYEHMHVGPRIEEYWKLRKLIQETCPDYLSAFDELLNSKTGYGYNMFICKKQLADDYFNWAFDLLKKMDEKIDYSTYEEGNKRILGYLSERLLNIYVLKNNLKVKEKPVVFTDTKFPLVYIVGFKISLIVILFKWFQEIKFKIH